MYFLPEGPRRRRLSLSRVEVRLRVFSAFLVLGWRGFSAFCGSAESICCDRVVCLMIGAIPFRRNPRQRVDGSERVFQLRSFLEFSVDLMIFSFFAGFRCSVRS